MYVIFWLTQSKPGPDPKFMKWFTVRIQSKFNKSHHSPDPVQSKTSPMLISARHCKTPMKMKNKIDSIGSYVWLFLLDFPQTEIACWNSVYVSKIR